MADKTEISWADSTFNPWIGCTKVGPGCDNCYAEADFDLRRHRAKWGPGNPRSRTSEANWKQPLRWNAKPFYECPGCGWRGDDPTKRPRCPTCDQTHMLKPTRRRVFCASLGDVFDNEVPRQWRIDLFRLIIDTPNLDWLLLTKRIGNAAKMLQDTAEHIGPMMDANDRYRPLPNVWLGATVCNQAEADRDIPKLLAVPARVRFLSIEPMLGPISMRWLPAFPENAPHTAQKPRGETNHLDGLRRLDWVVVGGESGHKARPISPDWVRGLRDQCAAAGVPFMFKQWGEWLPMLGQAEGVQVSKKITTEDGWVMGWAGKKAAGRLLDGVLHHEFPEERS